MLTAVGTEIYLFAGAGVISVLAFAGLILVPALGSFGRGWEKATAAVLSVFVLLALLGLGVALGVLIVYFWPEIQEVI